MTVTVTHSTVATLPDEPGAEVNKAEWNAAHTIVGLGTAASAATTDFDAAGAATAAVAMHEAAGDPHPQYLTAAEGDALFLTPAEGNAAYEASGAVATHAAAADPHTGYQKESERDAASGYAGVDAAGAVLRALAVRETSGPTNLVVGAIVDGEFLKRVGGTVVSAAPGAGSFSATQTTVTLPYASRRHSVSVIDAAVTAASKILVSLAGVAETITNSSDTVEVLSMQAVPGTGSFTFQATFLTPIGGPLTINYAVG